MAPYQTDLFDFDDQDPSDIFFQTDEQSFFDEDEEFGFDNVNKNHKFKKNINYDKQDLRTLDINRTKNRYFDKLVQSTKSYNFIGIWVNVVYLITFVLFMVFFGLNNFSFKHSESNYIAISLFLSLAFGIISYLTGLFMYGFIKMHNKRIKLSLTERALDYFILFKKAYVSYFLIGWIPLVGIIIGVSTHIVLQNSDDSDIKDLNLWYQESISDLLIDVNGYEDTVRQLETQKEYLDQEIQKINQEKQILDRKKNELALIPMQSAPNFKNSRQLVNYVENSGMLSASLINEVKTAITKLREERRKLRKENRRLRELLQRVNVTNDQPLLLTSSINYSTREFEDEREMSNRQPQSRQLVTFQQTDDNQQNRRRDNRRPVEIGQTKKENSNKNKSKAPVIVKKNKQITYKIKLTKKDQEIKKDKDDIDMSKQNDLLDLVSSMDYSSDQPTLSFDNLFNIEADDVVESRSSKTNNKAKKKNTGSNQTINKNQNSVKRATVN
ncbi:hypothetical protein [Mycoplasma bradburyae]|uniref:Transmembrane protein n=1 Tax=Mycoplasma bradburyae TaxID=2963128 RepID=A0AAW6HQC3_9MOLU|nr:hypothetical protein [Mycoplasma bradburyae]MDC4182116.1 hypothetical protein [Mycoplasma bradburyae]MDC4182881.1 hypothetical protein [Mycoplasma bradburyae]MDC4183564.1 hypothetical protein [Mycoplasma bradburyae]MDC4184302.1 hypothetical protein [Mycoplasma bradburyae]UTS70315.1 hypothetical protein NMG68_01045 [Mycoplasma bradburyae]